METKSNTPAVIAALSEPVTSSIPKVASTASLDSPGGAEEINKATSDDFKDREFGAFGDDPFSADAAPVPSPHSLVQPDVISGGENKDGSEKRATLTLSPPPPVSPMNSRAASFSAHQYKMMKSPGGHTPVPSGQLSARSTASVDPFDPFANSKVHGHPTQTSQASITSSHDEGSGVVVLHDDFATGGFDKNPFDEPFEMSGGGVKLANDPFGSTKAPAASDGFGDGFGGNPFNADFGPITPVPAVSNDGFAPTKADGFDDFGSSGFDSNPFDEPTTNSTHATTGAAAFDSFTASPSAAGAADPFASSEKGVKTQGGFDSW